MFLFSLSSFVSSLLLLFLAVLPLVLLVVSAAVGCCYNHLVGGASCCRRRSLETPLCSSRCCSCEQRLGEAVDRTILNHLLKMFTALGIYQESFEKPFLDGSNLPNLQQGSQSPRVYLMQDYLLEFQKRILQELKNHLMMYLHHRQSLDY